MKLKNYIDTIKKLNNLDKKTKKRLIRLATIEWILGGYKLIFIIPTMLLLGLQKGLDWVTDKLDEFCYNLPDVILATENDQKALVNALKERTVVQPNIEKAFEKK